MYCTVITAARQAGIMNGLTYSTGDLPVKLGQLVKIPLRNKLVEGIIIELSQTLNAEYDVKSVAEIVHEEPLLNEAQLKTLRWMAEYYFTTLRHVLGVWLPPPPWGRLVPEKVRGFSLGSSFDSAQDDKLSVVKGKKQKLILEYLLNRDWVSEKELKRELGVTSGMLKTLKEKKLIQEDIQEASANVERDFAKELKGLPVLTPAQQEVEASMKKDSRPSLLFGVTGSGKTEIYAQMIADTLKNKKQALVLVPEILLTEHSIQRYEQLLPRDAIMILHSRLTESARRTAWQKIRAGEIALVLGSRSSLFAPLQNLGLIIMDEEHEWTYKNEQTPRYHAREAAEELAKNFGAKFVMGTATPSLESWARAKEGRYHLERLPMRYREQAMPDVEIVDLASVNFGTMYPFSPTLLDAIEERLKRREQSVLFLNRRGVATSLLCLDCRRRVVSPESQLPFTVHHGISGKPFLMDHTTGLTLELPATCPHCASAKLLQVGAGTQRVETLLQQKFPQARLLRADADTISQPEQMRSLLSAMRENRADILLGTQSVVKGLDLPNVTLAAVILADVGLSLPHFRAGERIFQLLTQLTGRSGRAKPGEVIIQTFRPQASEILFASRHETEKYLDQELKLRAYTGYPPSSHMVRLIIRTPDALDFGRALTVKIQKLIDSRALTISAKCAPTFFGGGKEWHILLRGEDPKALLKDMTLKDVVVDVDPLETV